MPPQNKKNTNFKYKTMAVPNAVINPFSDAFLEHWELWKAYRWEEHKFKYKGVISEQMALKRLVELSLGDEEKAVRIINQSISRCWMDFYELKQPSVKNGKSSTKTGKTGESLRSKVSAAFNKRYGGGEETGGESHLKAV